MTSRERVIKALSFNSPDRVPRDLWWLPAVELSQKAELEKMLQRFPKDIETARFKPGFSERQRGKPALVAPGGHPPVLIPRRGKYIDEWGSWWCVGEDGVIGEVKEPVLDTWSKLDTFTPPWDYLETVDLREANQSCAESDKFMLSDICARPFERMQFLRGTENLFIDLAYGVKEVYKLRDMVHEFYLKYTEMWAKTDVDGLFFMDDWGTERSLLISPKLWRDFFKPLYKDYFEIAHAHGKYVFFHTDGHVREILADLVELEVDAINCQLFCMDVEEIGREFRGKITFWGEIDRRTLALGNPRDVYELVLRVRKALEIPEGGVIAQCEWGKNNPPENIAAVFEAWEMPLSELAALVNASKDRDSK